MRSTTVILILMMLSIKFQLAIAQSSNYTIESFQSEYIELSSYESVALLTQGDPLWEVEFPLNFEFPYYDSLYNRVIFNKESWGSFTDDQDEALYLMYFSRAYTYKDFTDTSNITSDVRFSHVEVNDMQAFVLQFTDNVFFADPYEGILDTYMNWQI